MLTVFMINEDEYRGPLMKGGLPRSLQQAWNDFGLPGTPTITVSRFVADYLARYDGKIGGWKLAINASDVVGYDRSLDPEVQLLVDETIAKLH